MAIICVIKVLIAVYVVLCVVVNLSDIMTED